MKTKTWTLKIYKDVAKQLQEAREAAGMTQEQLAYKLDTAQSVVSRIESGKHGISLLMLVRAARAMGYKLEINFSK